MDQVEKELFEQITRHRSAYEMAKDLSRGIFWVIAESEEELIDKNIFDIHIMCSPDGIPSQEYSFNSKNGETYNHKATWSRLDKSITKGKPFDYYPRGRVEIRNGKATIWMNGNILHLADDIKLKYGLVSIPVQVKEDGSEHYKCHFDK